MQHHLHPAVTPIAASIATTLATIHTAITQGLLPAAAVFAAGTAICAVVVLWQARGCR